jgi:hypothetical protein
VRPKKPKCLKDAIVTYRTTNSEALVLDEAAREVLDRLEKGKDAVVAFEKFGTAAAGIILHDCVLAERLFRKDFTLRVGYQRRLDAGMFDVAEKNVRGLLTFIKDPFLIEDSYEVDTARKGLRALANMIDGRRRLAELPIFGMTRKKDDAGDAPLNAAIKWLAMSVERRSGKPHYIRVARLT